MKIIIRYRRLFLFVFFILIVDSSLFAQIEYEKSNDPSVKISEINYNKEIPSAWKNKVVVSSEVSGIMYSAGILYIQFLDLKKTGKSYEFKLIEFGEWKYNISTNKKILGFYEFVDVYIDSVTINSNSGDVGINHSTIRIIPKNNAHEINCNFAENIFTIIPLAKKIIPPHTTTDPIIK